MQSEAPAQRWYFQLSKMEKLTAVWTQPKHQLRSQSHTVTNEYTMCAHRLLIAPGGSFTELHLFWKSAYFISVEDGVS